MQQEDKVNAIVEKENQISAEINRFITTLNKVKSQGKVMFKQEYGKLLEAHTDLTKKREEFLKIEEEINEEIKVLCENISETVDIFEYTVDQIFEELEYKKDMKENQML